MVLELETTVRRPVALETSVATVVGVTLEAMEETVALVEVRKQYFPSPSSVLYFVSLKGDLLLVISGSCLCFYSRTGLENNCVHGLP